MVSSSVSNSGTLTAPVDKSFNVAAKSDKTNLDFGKMMEKSLSASTQKNDYTKSDMTNNDNKVNDSLKKDNQKVDTQKTDVKKTDVQKNDSVELNEQDTNKVDKMLNDIKDEIKKKLGISDEQLESIMVQLGMTSQDLLQMNKVTELVSALTGTENTLSLITDSDLSDKLKSIMDFINKSVNQLSQELDLSPEELKVAVSQLKESEADVSFDNVNQKVNQEAVNENVQEAVIEDDGQNEQNKSVVTAAENTADDSLKSAVEEKLTVSTDAKNQGETSNGNKGESKQDAFTQISNNLTQSIEHAFENIKVDSFAQINTADIIRQIVDAAKVNVSQDMSSIEIQLNPENLGKLNLSVIAKDGVITAQLTAQNEAVKKAIENQITILKDNFNNQGIKVEAIEVTVQSHGFDGDNNFGENGAKSNDSKKSNKALSLDSLKDLSEDELSESEKRIMSMFNNDNSSVEYTA